MNFSQEIGFIICKIFRFRIAYICCKLEKVLAAKNKRFTIMLGIYFYTNIYKDTENFSKFLFVLMTLSSQNLASVSIRLSKNDIKLIVYKKKGSNQKPS